MKWASGPRSSSSSTRRRPPKKRPGPEGPESLLFLTRSPRPLADRDFQLDCLVAALHADRGDLLRLQRSDDIEHLRRVADRRVADLDDHIAGPQPAGARRAVL